MPNDCVADNLPINLSNYSKVDTVPANTTKQHIGPVGMIEQPGGNLIQLMEMAAEFGQQFIVKSQFPLPMEQMGQNHGIVVYQTVLPDSISLPADIDIELYGDRYGNNKVNLTIYCK